MSWRRGRGRPNLPQKMPTDTRNQRLRLFGPQKLNVCELPMWYTGRISAVPQNHATRVKKLKNHQYHQMQQRRDVLLLLSRHLPGQGYVYCFIQL